MLKEIKNLKNKGEFEKAIKLANKALDETKNQKEIAKIYLQLGYIKDQFALYKENEKEKKKLQKEAIDAFKKSMDNYEFGSIRGIGTVYHHQNKPEKALEFYKEAHKKYPEKAKTSYISFGNAYRRIGEQKNKKDYYKKAINFYNKSLNKCSKKSEELIPLSNLAILNSKLSNKKHAKNNAKKVLKIIKNKEENYVLESMKKEMQKIIDLK